PLQVKAWRQLVCTAKPDAREVLRLVAGPYRNDCPWTKKGLAWVYSPFFGLVTRASTAMPHHSAGTTASLGFVFAQAIASNRSLRMVRMRGQRRSLAANSWMPEARSRAPMSRTRASSSWRIEVSFEG